MGYEQEGARKAEGEGARRVRERDSEAARKTRGGVDSERERERKLHHPSTVGALTFSCFLLLSCSLTFSCFPPCSLPPGLSASLSERTRLGTVTFKFTGDRPADILRQLPAGREGHGPSGIGQFARS